MSKHTILTILLLPPLFTANKIHNIADYNANPDGTHDSAPHLLHAFNKTCQSPIPSTLLIPPGNFLVSQALLQGPCNNNNININIQGTITAPSSYTSNDQWITFKNINNLTISGGLFDGQGQSLWSCKNKNQFCPNGANSLTIAYCNNVWLNNVSSKNSAKFHISIYESSNVNVTGSTIVAPFDSPNTDGIHVEESSDVVIYKCEIGTGDDCVSMGPGNRNVWVENVTCGPGHGVSIGSLGFESEQDGVRNVTVKNVKFVGTENGFRIKTWAKPSSGFAHKILFQNATMNNVRNPIIIDQYYCPGNVNCPTQSSGIKISDVEFRDVKGTSATQTAVTLNCSESKPCESIVLKNIKLHYNGNSEAEMLCSNVYGGSSGGVVPPCCIKE